MTSKYCAPDNFPVLLDNGQQTMDDLLCDRAADAGWELRQDVE